MNKDLKFVNDGSLVGAISEQVNIQRGAAEGCLLSSSECADIGRTRGYGYRENATVV